MGYMRVLCELGRDTAIPADVATNTWHFESVGTVASAAAEAIAKLEVFYQAIDVYLSVGVTATINCKVYDLEDASPRVPVLEDNFAVVPSTGQALPEEVAIALSYAAAPASGVPAARRRGRIFIGPLDDAVLALESGTNRVFVPSSVRSALGVAAAAMSSTPTVDPVWSVFSPTTAGPGPWTAGDLGPAFFPVAGGYVDDAFDTIRSRGSVAVARTTWVA